MDTRVLNVLAGIAASAHKMSNDIRLLQHLKEVEEPFEKYQIGSSAMAYKRNPMRSERIASLSRYVIDRRPEPGHHRRLTQWFERTLDDSANKRLSIPEGFLAIDGILDLCLNVVDGLVVYPKVIEKHLMAELPFMATENIMMDAVKAGGDRQELHERIRELSMEAGKNVKVNGEGEQPSGADCRRSGLRPFPGGSEEDYGALPLCGTRPGAGRRVPGTGGKADSGEIQRYSRRKSRN